MLKRILILRGEKSTAVIKARQPYALCSLNPSTLNLPFLLEYIAGF
jgi:hypothetical protein